MAKPSTELKRAVGPWGAIWMGLGSILGTGVFVSLGIGAEIIGSGLLLAVTLAALIAIANGLSSAQLAAAHPVSGGTYEYGHKFIGPKAGLVAGWMFLLAKSASAGTAALGFSGYVFHSIGTDASRFNKIGLALALVFVLTALVSRGIQRSNRANQIIVALTLTTLACFVVFGWLSVDLALVSERIGPKTWIEAFESPYALLNATGLMFVAYTGYGRIATLGEEVLEPAKTIPKAIIGALGLTMVLYIGVAATALATVGAAAFANTTAAISAPLEGECRNSKPLKGRLGYGLYCCRNSAGWGFQDHLVFQCVQRARLLRNHKLGGSQTPRGEPAFSSRHLLLRPGCMLWIGALYQSEDCARDRSITGPWTGAQLIHQTN